MSQEPREGRATPDLSELRAVIPRVVRFVPALIAGELDCGVPLLFSPAVKTAAELASQLQTVFQAENVFWKMPFHLKTFEVPKSA